MSRGLWIVMTLLILNHLTGYNSSTFQTGLLLIDCPIEEGSRNCVRSELNIKQTWPSPQRDALIHVCRENHFESLSIYTMKTTKDGT